jgi:ribonucleoside-diphosphate reductase beta chain
MFQAGEEAVTLDLLPLIMTVAKEGRIEEEMFLTTFLFEEAKHTEFFRLFLNAVGADGDLSHFHAEPYRKVFYEILPSAMNRLVHDTSPEAIADASVVYNMFVEGVLAETGYYSFYQSLAKVGTFPGLLKGIDYLKRDESRHIAYGTFLLQRLICEKPSLYDHIQTKLAELAPLAMQINESGLSDADRSEPGYVEPSDIMAFTAKQLSLRLEKLARAKEKTIEELYKTSEEALGVI